MKNYYVTVDAAGYIDNWCVVVMDGYTKIKADDALFGRLGCVKVVGDVAVLDSEKQKELSEIEPIPNELELLKQENQELKERIDMTELALLEVTDMLLNHELGGESNV